MNYSSSKYMALLKGGKNDIQKEEQEDKRENAAKFLVKQLLKGSTWFKIDTVKQLVSYLDFDFVRASMINVYKSTNDLELKRAIKECHDGVLDISDVLERKERERKEEEKIRATITRIQAKRKQDIIEEESIAQDHMSLLAMKTQQVRGSSLN